MQWLDLLASVMNGRNACEEKLIRRRPICRVPWHHAERQRGCIGCSGRLLPRLGGLKLPAILALIAVHVHAREQGGHGRALETHAATLEQL